MDSGAEQISSGRLSELTSIPAHTIRKDISYAAGAAEQVQNSSGSGYSLERLLPLLKEALGLLRTRRVCVVGLGKLGSALINFPGFLGKGYVMHAGFDRSVNRLELLNTKVPLYTSSEITDVCRRERIDLGVITAPPEAAQGVADRLIEGGVQGIVNFAPVIIQKREAPVFVRNIFVAGEFHILSAMIHQEGEKNEG